MTGRYSALSLALEGFRGQKGWEPIWKDAKPKDKYDVIIIGGGGHGLATAYYLAKTHGVTNVAVLEKGWIGGGNTGRNTTAIRSNYFYPESAALYEKSVQLYEGLSRELNYNIMFSQRGLVRVFHSEAEMEMITRLVNAMQVNGIDSELLDEKQTRAILPRYNQSEDCRYPLVGAMRQGRGGTARHDAVAWGYARAASQQGVDIIQGCEVDDFLITNGVVEGVETNLGRIKAERVGVAVAGHSTVLAKKAGFDLPVHSYTLQAMVSEPIKPFLDTVAISASTGCYISQSDKGEMVMGGGLDRMPSYNQKGNIPMTQAVMAGLVEMFPELANLKMLRQWGGIVDVVPDSSPILSPTPVSGLFYNCGWGTGGFKAIPVGGTVLAHLLATGDHHELSAPFDLKRFETGALVDEAAGAGIDH